MTSVPFFLLFFVIVVSYSAWRGGAPERLTALAFVVALAGSASVGLLHMPGRFRVVPVQVFAFDVMLLIALCIIAVRANRWWPIPVAGCQLVAVLVHMGKLIDPAMIPNSYAFLITIWSWPMVALLGIGTWKHRELLRRGIIKPNWKRSWHRPTSPNQRAPLSD